LILERAAKRPEAAREKIMTKPLRIGVLGAANIARAFCAGVAPSSLVKVTTIASRDAAKGAAFAKEVGVARSVGSYEALLADPEIDAIYNPLPNGMHFDWSIRAVRAGKHVLCEKPLCSTGAEAITMFGAAEKAGVHLVEAYPYRAQPQTLKLAELVHGGAIGRLRQAQGNFGITIADPANVRWDAGLAGGALMDAGSYPISLMRLVARERPARVRGLAEWSASGVDRSFAGMLEFPSGFVAQISCSFATGFHRHAQIAGELGAIQTTYLNHPPLGGAPILNLTHGVRSDNARYETITVEGGNGFLLETESFARLVASGPSAWNGATPEESIDIAFTLDALLQSARSGKPVDVGV
jgi:predicted dehydrogenase